MGSLPESTTDQAVPEEVAERRVVLVASAGAEPTRPHVAANLAAIYAEAGQSVIVMSTGDLEKAVRGSIDEIRPENVKARLQPSRLENVSRLPLAPFVANSGQLVNRAPALLDVARGLADMVIVEVPPILAVHHAEALARAVDVVLVVAECRLTTFNDARLAGDLLRRIGAPVLGVVLTNMHISRGDIRQLALADPRRDDEPSEHDGEPVLALDAAGASGTDTQPRA
jgi:Mrp family chromosome partitioning ATPase